MRPVKTNVGQKRKSNESNSRSKKKAGEALNDAKQRIIYLSELPGTTIVTVTTIWIPRSTRRPIIAIEMHTLDGMP